jgi:molybdenum cofactor cytidylyltransferase
MKNTVAIILAAGSSSRLGQSKQLLKFKGRTLLRYCAEVATQSICTKVVVVLGSQSELHARELHTLPVEIITNHDWEKGVGNSLRFGVNYVVDNHSNATGILVLLCDQPAISAEHINHLINKFSFSQSKIIASVYRDTIGVPALFDISYVDQLRSISDSHGAKAIIQENRKDVDKISFPGGEIDVDTKEDYNKIS